MNNRNIYLFVRLLTCFLLLLAVAVQRDARYAGNDLKASAAPDTETPVLSDEKGNMIISTRSIARDIMGYGGNIPLRITISDGRIADIEALPNAETPDFFEKVRSELIPKWIGLSIDEALQTDVDGISGASRSSEATIETIRRAMLLARKTRNEAVPEQNRRTPFSAKEAAALLVVALGGLLPFFIRSPRYRVAQLVLNVAVLGLWCGSFLSYSLMVNYLSNGFRWPQALVPLLMLVTAFVYPFFGKKGHYCAWICPLGSLQELAGKCRTRKWILPTRLVHILELCRDGLWALLMLLMWCGVAFSWMNYELFTAFLFRQAPVAVLVVTLAFVGLACFIPRPYCRFVCPTGSLIRITQNPK